MLGSSPHIPSIFSPLNAFFLLFQLIIEWKYLVLQSLSNKHLDLAFCLRRDLFLLITFQKDSCNSILLDIFSSVRLWLSSFSYNSLRYFIISWCILCMLPNYDAFHSSSILSYPLVSLLEHMPFIHDNSSIANIFPHKDHRSYLETNNLGPQKV